MSFIESIHNIAQHSPDKTAIVTYSHGIGTEGGTKLSYAEVYDVVKAEMAVPSQLLEHVAGRICQALLHRFPAAQAIHLEILKENPPMGADCAGAGVCVEVNRLTH